MAHEAPQRRYQYTGTGNIVSGAAVTKAGVGLIKYADKSAADRFLGVSLQLLAQNQHGDVKTSGRVPGDVFSVVNFVENVIPADNSRIWLGLNGQFTVSPPADLSGHQQQVVGLWDDGDLLLQPHFLGIA